MFPRLTCVACLIAPVAAAGAAGAAPAVFQVADGGNGHAYDVVLDPGLTRDGATRVASAVSGHLVTITSAQEQAFVESLLLDSGAPTGSYWMGMERASSDQFRWVTNEPFEYNNFPGGEPNNFQGVENAGQIYWSQDLADDFAGRRGTWNDAPLAGYTEGDIPDLIRAGLVFEIELPDPTGGDGGGGPMPIPLPPALLAGPLAAAAGALTLRRRRVSAV